ncbi:DUF2069 domain-containing protein [Jeongeupia naejangsanensis]|uniref:DUF2069 domain-containing protein n=1 Tax=Jeongeupia naejangsanensis TaxID=613195 RepID=A0ABS2BPI8_9NEIS|nr:DUF2069 domain-containing protein [Jeongeupia naejangsanensis]MBM3117547.1 DUF2069 domain-containing protein [Jeongeupia naejangsanensis]
MSLQKQRDLARIAAVGSVVALIALCLAWELVLAPLRTGGSTLALKALPLLLPLRGLIHGRRYTYQWTSMFILLWWAEGLMRVWSDAGLSRWLAGGEVVLATICFVAVSYYAKWTRPSVLAAEAK